MRETEEVSSSPHDMASPATERLRAVGLSARPARETDAAAMHVPKRTFDIIQHERIQSLIVLPGSKGTPVAACTLLMEPKFLRGAGSVAHLTEQLVRGGRMRAEVRLLLS